MKCLVKYIVVCALVASSVCYANTSNTQSQASNTIKMSAQAKQDKGYQEYLREMKQLNADRKCAALTPQHVYTYQEYKQHYY